MKDREPTAVAREQDVLWRLIKVLFWLVILGAIALVLYAYLGPIFMADDFAAPSQTMTVPVELSDD